MPKVSKKNKVLRFLGWFDVTVYTMRTTNAYLLYENSRSSLLSVVYKMPNVITLPTVKYENKKNKK